MNLTLMKMIDLRPGSEVDRRRISTYGTRLRKLLDRAKIESAFDFSGYDREHLMRFKFAGSVTVRQADELCRSLTGMDIDSFHALVQKEMPKARAMDGGHVNQLAFFQSEDMPIEWTTWSLWDFNERGGPVSMYNGADLEMKGIVLDVTDKIVMYRDAHGEVWTFNKDTKMNVRMSDGHTPHAYTPTGDCNVWT
jgi:hypothetical protein